MKTFLILMLSAQALSLYLGDSRNSRIVGGQEAFAGQFPSAAALYKTTSNGNFFCTGTILSTEWIITAGQCVDGAISFTILIGTHKLNGDEATVERLSTSEYVLHPDFNPATLANDIGLIKFRSPISYNDYIYSALLPSFNLVDGHGIAYGWGQTADDDGELSNTLQTVTLQSLTDTECKLTYGNQITEYMICFAGNYNEGTCLGDSGSPVIQEYKGYHMVFAVSSFHSANGCESADPSGYTRIYPYNDWIKNITYDWTL